jgi:hypothetical protein
VRFVRLGALPRRRALVVWCVRVREEGEGIRMRRAHVGVLLLTPAVRAHVGTGAWWAYARGRPIFFNHPRSGALPFFILICTIKNEFF